MVERLRQTVPNNRPLSFISLSHSDNQSESTTKFYNSFKADVGGERADTDLERTEICRTGLNHISGMPTDFVKFPVN